MMRSCFALCAKSLILLAHTHWSWRSKAHEGRYVTLPTLWKAVFPLLNSNEVDTWRSFSVDRTLIRCSFSRNLPFRNTWGRSHSSTAQAAYRSRTTAAFPSRSSWNFWSLRKLSQAPQWILTWSFRFSCRSHWPLWAPSWPALRNPPQPMRKCASTGAPWPSGPQWIGRVSGGSQASIRLHICCPSPYGPILNPATPFHSKDTHRPTWINGSPGHSSNRARL
jgi:hypothetical protein